MPIRLLGDAVLRRKAWAIAEQLGWVETFDAECVALTQLQADAFVTLDAELARRGVGVVPTATSEHATTSKLRARRISPAAWWREMRSCAAVDPTEPLCGVPRAPVVVTTPRYVNVDAPDRPDGPQAIRRISGARGGRKQLQIRASRTRRRTIRPCVWFSLSRLSVAVLLRRRPRRRRPRSTSWRRCRTWCATSTRREAGSSASSRRWH